MISTPHNHYHKWIALGVLIALVAAKPVLPDFLIRPPAWLVLPFADWINTLFAFLRDDLGLLKVSRWFAGGMEFLLDIAANLLYGKKRWPNLEPLPWSMMAVSAFFVGWALRGYKLALLSGGAFVWVAVAGQWKWTMETFSVIVVAAPFAILSGLILGIIAWRWRYVEKLLLPLLNIAQSLPHFAYMIPVVVFIGVGPKAGAIVTIIFAIPPMIRMTLLGLKKVPEEVIESGKMCGATKAQLLWKARVPTARTEILIGINQVIMQCLAMVVLASFIGMPGLGQKLLQLLQALKIGRSVEIGITIVLLAVVLDQCSKAWIEKQPRHFERGTPWWRRHQLLLGWVGALIACYTLTLWFPYLAEVQRAQAWSMSKPLDAGADWLIEHIGPYSYGLRSVLIRHILIPMRDAYLWLPYSAVLAFVAAIAWRLGRRRSLLTGLLYVGFIAMSGWWDRAMITVYMVSFAVFLSALIGLPLGIWASAKAARAKWVLLICDTAQTFPSFIYLIPVIMLFGVNDVAAIFAVVVFGTVPMTRYTIEGLRGVPGALTEAADMSGANKWQKLWHVKIPMAFPVIMAGVNQTVLFSLFMVIIAAFIGTQDLGQEMQRALSSTDVGKGLVLGFCVAFMGLLTDHLITVWSASRKRALGLE